MHRRSSIGSAAAALLLAAFVLLLPVRAALAAESANNSNFVGLINTPGVTVIDVTEDVTTTSKNLTVQSGVSINLDSHTWTINSGTVTINGSVSGGAVVVNADAKLYIGTGGSVASYSGAGEVYASASNLGSAVTVIPGVLDLASDGTDTWKLTRDDDGSYWCEPSKAGPTVVLVTTKGGIIYRHHAGDVWERIVYTITYQTGSGTNPASNPTSFNKYTDLPLTLKAAIPSAAQRAQGIVFLYWSGGNVDVNESNASILPADTASDQVLTAVWGEPVSGGSGSMAGGSGGFSLGGYSLGSGGASSSAADSAADDEETTADDTATEDESTTQTVRVRQARSTTQITFANGSATDMAVPTAESVKKKSFPWGWAVAGAAALFIAGTALYAHKHRDDDFEEE